MKHLLTFAIILSGFLAQAHAQDREAFVEKLLGQMTLDEKIGQMTLFTSDWDVTGPSLRPQYKDDIKTGKVGSMPTRQNTPANCSVLPLKTPG
jgi:hypothetical protein